MLAGARENLRDQACIWKMVPGCALAIAIGAVLNKRGYFSGGH